MKVELDSSNYTTKADLKNATDVDTLKFAKMVDLASLRSNQGFIETLKLMSALLKEIEFYKKKADRSLVGFQGVEPRLLNVFKAIKQLTMALKNYVQGLRIYTSS